MPSLGVVAEAVAQGEAFPVPVYGADEGILRVSQVPLLSYRYRPKDEDDYVAYVSRVSSNLGDAREEAREARYRFVKSMRDGFPARRDQSGNRSASTYA